MNTVLYLWGEDHMIKSKAATVVVESKEPIVEVTIEVFCSNCPTQLISVFKNTPYQASNALQVTLTGGYGMYYDDIPETSLLCRECASNLLKEFPCLLQRTLSTLQE